MTTREWYNDPALRWEEITDLGGIGIYVTSWTLRRLKSGLHDSLIAAYIRSQVRLILSSSGQYAMLAAIVNQAERGELPLAPGALVLTAKTIKSPYRITLLACPDGRLRMIFAHT